MGRNVQDAASGSSQIARSLVSVSQAAGGATTTVEHTNRSAGDLAQRASELQALVGRFRY